MEITKELDKCINFLLSKGYHLNTNLYGELILYTLFWHINYICIKDNFIYMFYNDGLYYDGGDYANCIDKVPISLLKLKKYFNDKVMYSF